MTEDKSAFDSFELQLNSLAKDYLKSAAGWATAVAIIGFIFTGFMVLAGFAMFAIGGEIAAQSGTPMTGALLGFLYLAIAVIYLFPLIYLMRFASSAKRAIDTYSNEQLVAAFKNLKNHYMSIIIIIIATVVLYIVMAIIFAAKYSGQF